jgi:SAM-dependent methyltransferase
MLIDLLDLGDQYLSAFRDDDSKPPKFPLCLQICMHCHLVQLSETAPRELLYRDDYGFYSGVNEGIVKDLESAVIQALSWKPNATNWLDIASNDGTLLSFVPQRIYRVGIDPVEKFGELALKHADRVISDYFSEQAVMTYERDVIPAVTDTRFDVVTSISMFYDVDDPGEFVTQVAKVLAPNGIWVIQQNYVKAMLEANSLDNICHEHITYWSLAALVNLLDRHGMQVLDVQTSDINGGSFRTVVASKDAWFHPNSSVDAQLKLERVAKLNEPHTYQEFGRRAYAELSKLRALLDRINRRNQECYLYAASTRGAVIWQAAQVDELDCRFAVERNPDKVGKMFSAVGVPIISEAEARDRKPAYMLIGPWWFRSQIIEREKRYLNSGGKLIFPLPHLEIIGKGGKPARET